MTEMDRRQYLKLFAATAAVGALAGCSQTPEKPETVTSTPEEKPVTPTPEESPGPGPDEETIRYGIEFKTVLNAVDDLGMDPEGKEPIDDALLTFLEKRRSTLLEFPPGSYRFEDSHEVETVNSLGIRGLGDDRGDVVFTTPAEEGRRFISIRQGGVGFLLENVTFDHGPGKGSIGNVLRLDDKLRVQNVEHAGFNPTNQDGALDNLSPQILSKDGVAIVDSYVRTGPTHIVSHGHLDGNSNAGCIWLGEDHVGTLRIRNSHFANTGTNTIYCSRTEGRVEVRNCQFENNNQASLRIGGKGSLVKNCTFFFDTDDAHPDNVGEYINPNAIVWETGNKGLSGGIIDGCLFVYNSAPDKTVAAIWADGSAGAFTVKNSRFSINVPGIQAIRIDDPKNPRLGKTAAKPWGVKLTNLVIEGSNAGVVPMIEINGRPNSALDGCCISVSDAKDVVKLIESPGSSLQNINVTGTEEWLAAQQSEFVAQDISYEQLCQLDSSAAGSST